MDSSLLKLLPRDMRTTTKNQDQPTTHYTRTHEPHNGSFSLKSLEMYQTSNLTEGQ